MALKMGVKHFIEYDINQTDLLAPTAHFFIAPVDGHVTSHQNVVQVGVTTGGTLALVNVTKSNAAMTGCTTTVANGATAGTKVTATPGLVAAVEVSAGDVLKVTPASFATAGAVRGLIEITGGKAVP